MVTQTSTPTRPGSLVVAATGRYPQPDRWMAQIGDVWVNTLGVHVRTLDLLVLAVLSDADPDAEVNHR